MNLKLLSRYGSAFLAYSLGKIHLSYPPLFFSIEATNICNFQCKYCPQSNPESRALKRGHMSIELFEDILKQVFTLKPVAQLYLTGNGEPLMHPHLEKFITLSNRYGFIPGFASNGSLFTEERNKSLLDSGKFLVAVDFSPIKEIYENYRSGGSWDTVYANLKNLLAQKRRRGGSCPKIEIRDMSTIAFSSKRDREKSLSDLKKLFENEPVNKFSQMKVHAWTGNIDPKIVPSRTKSKRYKLCTHPWSLFVVTWNGEVLACCRDFESEYVIGRIDGENRIEDLWNNHQIKSLRSALVNKRPHEINICKNCDRPWTGGSVAKSKPQMIKKILWEKMATS